MVINLAIMAIEHINGRFFRTTYIVGCENDCHHFYSWLISVSSEIAFKCQLTTMDTSKPNGAFRSTRTSLKVVNTLTGF